ncbi:hypothetical protein [Methylobacterium sp. J-092]|uniref:hypothetical protein n=1 Tax=Methylobacterium sp. J-092 TaxID=2836667 RepID=UPI001FBB48EA|nr:hypothetical protein [Methylobacterium sp. J-092]MCJ2008206.1 hypothetical protein [Methylobacterium sp. J-092]
MAIYNLTLPNGGGERYCSPRSQIGPVTLALRAMRTPNPDQAADDAIEAIRRGLDRHFSEVDHDRLQALRRRVADRIQADLALLDALDGDPDLDADHVTCERAADGSLYLLGRSTDDEDGDNGCGDLDGALEQHGHGAFNDVVFA